MENPVGRPLRYKTVEELETAIEEYFNSCQPEFLKDAEGKVMTDNKNNPILVPNPPTLTGLALHLGFCSRQSIYDYENRENEFSYIIKAARLKCEHWTEKALLSNNVAPAAGIFVLKNYGWKDEKALDMTSGGERFPVNITIEGVKPETSDTE